MGEIDYRVLVEDLLPSIGSADDIYGLFRRLGYPSSAILDPTYKRRISEFGFAKEEEEKVVNIYTVLNFEKNLNAFLVQTKTPANITVRFLRYLTKIFSDHYLRFLLIVTSDYKTISFVLPDFEKKDVGELKLKIVRLQIDLTNLYYTDKQTISNLGLTGSEKDWRDVWFKWRDAFNVKRVTDEFFRFYAGDPESIFFKVRKELIRQKISRKEAHEFTLQLLNRIMFIYFVAKKRWLNNEPRFMRWLWQYYLKERNNGRAKADSFYDKWLKTIFFEAFNNKFTPHSDLPEDVNRIFYTVPYLNGGLFREEEIDEISVKIKDDLFREIFDFFERYNFTIREELPFDVEVAVDPQMIGYVYESLANVAEEIYDRNDLGIFYTPRVEVDFMCRRSLVEYLHNHLPEVSKDLWYRLVFDEDTESVEKQLTQMETWYDLEEKLDAISVVDPACGSGAFLVGMLNVLTGLHKIVNRNLDRANPDFEIKKRIISKSLYGVDVMPWAIHAAELRLWLQLVVESPLEPKDLRTYPLLPNLNMNLRVGDSLVQEIGNLTLHLRDPQLSEKVRKKLTDLKQEKENYINNAPTAKFKRREEVDKEEIRIFQEIIEERLQFLQAETVNIRNKIKREESQKTLSGEKATLDEARHRKIQELEGQVERYNREEYELKRIRENLPIPGKKPFVWEIDFAEIFGEKAGFDIVIGNPPYVRQEMISPPNKLKEEVTLDDRRRYKVRLLSSVTAHFPVVRQINKKSDLYIYFYFHGMALLNQKGTFCFVTSNSWLDVGYGKELQEFLLEHVPIIAIYDNQAKRTFEHADINTIIAFLKAPLTVANAQAEFGGLISEQKTLPALSNVVRFVMLKKSFEEVINTKNLIDLDDPNENKETDMYHVHNVKQVELLEEGWEYPEGYGPNRRGDFEKGKYVGSQWGGRYLRAPAIFYVVLEKGREKLVKLGKIAEVCFGIKTGVNDFFYLQKIDHRQARKGCLHVRNEAGWKGEIEKEFLRPIIKSPKECDTILIDPSKLRYMIFMCHKTKKELRGTKALEYIEWGEREKTADGVNWSKVPSVSGRKNWYDLGKREPANLNFNYLINDIGTTYIGPVLASDNFHSIDTEEDIGAFMNSSVFWLFQNVLGRRSFGGGLLKIQRSDLVKMLVLPLETPKLKSFLFPINNVFEECGISNERPVRAQIPTPKTAREELDNKVFEALGLNNDERREVYWSLCELVRNRLDKSTSLGNKDD